MRHSEYEERLTLLSLRMEAVEGDLSGLKRINQKLRKENASLKSQNATLSSALSELQAKLKSYELVKDSSNSSKPPSQDMIKQTKSLRKRSGKPSGGQPGHKGHTLDFCSSPDERYPLVPSYCGQCGGSLSVEEAQLVSARQVVEIPPIKARYLEYQCYGIDCPCGHFQQASYPSGVNSPIQYSERVGALVSYLSVYQYLPYKRLSSALTDLFGLKISQGSIFNLLEKVKTRALPIYEHIRARMAQAPVVGSDETSAVVNGKKQWIWAWQNKEQTFLAIDASRGKVAVEAQFPKGFPNSILQSDRWPAQVNTPAQGYQLCLAHLERNLTYLEALEKQNWTIQMQKLIKAARKAKQEKEQYDPDEPKIKRLEKRLDRLLQQTFCQEKAPKSYAMRNSLAKHREKLLTFLYHQEVLPDNNGSERAIRNVRVKQKISGQFKSGHKAFCVIRSLIDTAIKQNKNVWEILSLTAQLNTT